MNLANHFLLAMPNLEDSLFSGSLIYLCEHGENGAMGVIVNKPSPVTMNVVFAAIGKDTPARFKNQYVMMGGPMQTERGFVLHTPIGNWDSSLSITDSIALTTSRDIIEGLHQDDEIQGAVLTIGYSGWSAGQLEQEIAQNSWLTVPADPHILFGIPPEKRYAAAFGKLGIRRENFAGAMGHA
ncbi:MAG: YqgE/AlgH family protein [Kingella oralis]